MRRNTEVLLRSAKLRSASALERAQTAIRHMQANEESINFRTVAAKAGVSTAWLYDAKLLRDRIMRLRAVPMTPAANDTRKSRMTSQERVIATLRFRIKLLEEKNQELSEQLERTYGKLALTHPNATSAHHASIDEGTLVRSRKSAKW